MTTRESIIKKIEEIEDNFARDQKELYAGIGQFVCAVAAAESEAHNLFEYILKLKNSDARAIVGGSRLTDLLSIIQRLTANSKLGEAEKNEIGAIVSQLREISSLRNFICHSGAGVGDEGKFSSMNLHTAKTFESVKILEGDLKTLCEATTDAQRISFRIFRLTSKKYRKEFEQLPGHIKKEILGPWRYKFVEPRSLGQKTQQKKGLKH